MEATRYKAKGPPALVKELVTMHAKIEETRLGLQLTLNADVDSGRIVDDINNAKEVIKYAYAALKSAKEQNADRLHKTKRKAWRKAKGEAKAE